MNFVAVLDDDSVGGRSGVSGENDASVEHDTDDCRAGFVKVLLEVILVDERLVALRVFEVEAALVHLINVTHGL